MISFRKFDMWGLCCQVMDLRKFRVFAQPCKQTLPLPAVIPGRPSCHLLGPPGHGEILLSLLRINCEPMNQEMHDTKCIYKGCVNKKNHLCHATMLQSQCPAEHCRLLVVSEIEA